MSRITFAVILAIAFMPMRANAQYDTEEARGPWFGGPGNYVYPMVCQVCSTWQDYRNFAWNQLSIAGGSARTPVNPGNATVFRIFTDTSNDRFPAVVVVTLEFVDVPGLGTVVGQQPTEPRKYIVDTILDNGDAGESAMYPPQAGPFQVPHAGTSGDEENESETAAPSPSGNGGSRAGGDSPSGGESGGIWGGGYGGGLFDPTGGWWGGGGGGTYCGPGTEWHCVRL